MNCLWCDAELLVDINWISLLKPSRPMNLCDKCLDHLQVLSGKRCDKCSRLTELSICEDCLWWKSFQNGDDALDGNYSVFPYSNYMQEVIAKWKYRGDYVLGYLFQNLFVEHYLKIFKTLENPILVPIPLSKQRLQERSFNQAKMLTDFLPDESKEILSRIDGEKQSKKSRKERIFSQNPFILHQKLNKPVILVDDIYTTGTTLRHAARLLKSQGCPKVYAYTLVRG